MSQRFLPGLKHVFGFALILLQTGYAVGQMKMKMDTGDPVPPQDLPAPEHMTGTGNARFPITGNAEAQMWFEQGYNLYYDFWDYEADRAFEQAIRSDANCAMCYWGLYQAETFTHSEAKDYAKDALAKAVALEPKVTPREKLYIQAAEAHESAIREAGSEDKANFDHETEILRTMVKDNPSDTNARILLAEAVSDGFDEKGEPKKGKKEAIALLQGVLKEEPDNSVANHLWIHAVEPSLHPEQALHSAEILSSLAPASGHMVHMPGHIFYRTGDYVHAQEAFDASAVADERYMQEQHVAIDNDWNYVHNLMYSVANLLEEGQFAEATRVSGKLNSARGHLENTLYRFSARDSVARLNPELPIALRTGDWARVVAMVKAANPGQTMPHMEFLARALSQFALGMQAVETRKSDEAERLSLLLDAGLWRLSQEVKDAPKDKPPFTPDPTPGPLVQFLSIMSLELRASLLATQDRIPEAEKLFAQARQEEKDLGYREPPTFIRPVAENEAMAMMTAGKWPEAKAAAQKALLDRPMSGFALYGIAQATEKTGDAAATGAAYQQFLAAWKTADPGLPQIEHAKQWLDQHGIPGS
jgi:tetratricopeptide (TPR) repeat protein